MGWKGGAGLGWCAALDAARTRLAGVQQAKHPAASGAQAGQHGSGQAGKRPGLARQASGACLADVVVKDDEVTLVDGAPGSVFKHRGRHAHPPLASHRDQEERASFGLRRPAGIPPAGHDATQQRPNAWQCGRQCSELAHGAGGRLTTGMHWAGAEARHPPARCARRSRSGCRSGTARLRSSCSWCRRRTCTQSGREWPRAACLSAARGGQHTVWAGLGERVLDTSRGPGKSAQYAQLPQQAAPARAPHLDGLAVQRFVRDVVWVAGPVVLLDDVGVGNVVIEDLRRHHAAAGWVAQAAAGQRAGSARGSGARRAGTACQECTRVLDGGCAPHMELHVARGRRGAGVVWRGVSVAAVDASGGGVGARQRVHLCHGALAQLAAAGGSRQGAVTREAGVGHGAVLAGTGTGWQGGARLTAGGSGPGGNSCSRSPPRRCRAGGCQHTQGALPFS